MGRADKSDRIVYGIGPVRELIERRAKEVAVLWVAAGSAGGKRRGGDDVAERARKAGIAVQQADREHLDSLCGGGTHQGVVAVARRLPLLRD